MKREKIATSLKIKQPQNLLFLLASTVSLLLISNSNVSAGFQWSASPTRTAPQMKYLPTLEPVLEVPTPTMIKPVLVSPSPDVISPPLIVEPMPITENFPITVTPVPSEQFISAPAIPTYSRATTQSEEIDAPMDLVYTPNEIDVPAALTITKPALPKVLSPVQEISKEVYLPESIIETAIIENPSDFFIVEGFGSDIPMALALRQIVPPEYGFAFGDGVNPGYRVSWSGGKPWDAVVQDMIAPLQLRLRVYGTTVSIKTNGGSSVPLVMTPETISSTQPLKIVEPYIEAKPVSAVLTPILHFSSKAHENNDEWKWDHGVIIKPDPVIKQKIITPVKQKTLEDLSLSPRRMNITDPGKNVGTQPQQLIMMPKSVREEIQDIGFITEEDQNLIVPDEPTQLITKISSTEEIALVVIPEKWSAKQGDSLRAVLKIWSANADANLVWGGDKDYTVNSDIKIDGTYENALQVLFSYALDNETRPSHSLLSQTNDGTVVYNLVVQDNSK